MSKYILHYFRLNGRGIIPRAILTYAKADWTNDVIQQNGQKSKKVDYANSSNSQS